MRTAGQSAILLAFARRGFSIGVRCPGACRPRVHAARAGDFKPASEHGSRKLLPPRAKPDKIPTLIKGTAVRVARRLRKFDRENAMFNRLMPRQGRFFEMFNEHAEQIVRGSHELAALMASHDDLERRTHTIEAIEKRADKITRATIELVHKTFITPIDREDIHQLISKMDDILDMIEDSAQLMFLYDVRVLPPDAKKLADICVVCCEKVKSAVALLSSMDNAAEMLTLCSDIDRLESDADHVMRDAIARLFRDEPDVRELIKLRSVYEHLETVTDCCEDVANIIQGIVIENS